MSTATQVRQEGTSVKLLTLEEFWQLLEHKIPLSSLYASAGRDFRIVRFGKRIYVPAGAAAAFLEGMQSKR